MKRLILFIIMLCMLSAILYSQWSYFEFENERVLTVVKFNNDSAGLILGHDGIVLETDDRGESWTILPNDLDASFFDFQFINDTLIFAYAPGAIFVSEDSGSGWEEKAILPSNAQMAYFKDADTGFAGNNVYGLERTVDGGSNWTLIWDHPADNVSFCEVNSMDFLNDQIGYAGGRGRITGEGGFSYIIKSVDGGASWTEVFGSSTNDIGHPVDIQCLNDSVIYAVDDDFDLLRSADAGENWSVEKFSDPDWGVPAEITATSLFVFSTDTVFVTGETTMWPVKNSYCFSKRKILQTKDGGKHWINQFFEEDEFPECGPPLLGNITFINDSTGICPGWNLILRTTNRGGDTHMPDTAIHGSIEDLARDESGILVYPNPSSEYLTIELSNGDFDQLEIFTLSGNLVKIQALKRSNTFNINALSSGTYLFKFSGKKTCYRKILVFRP